MKKVTDEQLVENFKLMIKDLETRDLVKYSYFPHLIAAYRCALKTLMFRDDGLPPIKK